MRPGTTIRQLIVLPIIVFAPMLALAQDEYRGMWISRFEWPKSTEALTKSTIDSMISTCRNANFNSLFFQIRGSCETLYPSPNEPWGLQFNFTDQGYDPLTYAVSAAHGQGLEFHAYINAHTICQTTSGAPTEPPPHTVPEHPFWLHGNPDDPGHDDWCYVDSTGTTQPLGAGENYYMWAAPGVPSFAAWWRQQVLYVANTYNIDGVHFDRIRTAGDGSHDPASIARQAGPGNPGGLSFQNWQRDQITRMLNDVYGAIAEVNANRPGGKPHIKISAAPYPSVSSQLGVNQDVASWTSIGGVDFFCPMIYTGTLSTFNSYLAGNMGVRNGRFVVAGMSRGSANMTTLFSEVTAARTQNAHGNVVFSYTGFGSGEIGTYPANVFPTFVSPPSMGWIASPTDAIVVGNVVDGFGNPVVDAWLTRADNPGYTWLSGGDGFYSMLKVPAGTALSINCQKTGLPARTATLTARTAGSVTRVNFTLRDSQGTIEFDSIGYPPSALPRITVHDEDLAGSGTLAIPIHSQTAADDEIVTLTEVGSTGLFHGIAQLGTGAPVAADGVLQVAGSDLITARYEDADDGTGWPAAVTDSAAVDAQPPVISPPVVAVPGPNSVSITFTTNEETTALIRFGDSCASLASQADDPVLSATHTFVLTELADARSYYFSLQAADPAGNLTQDNNGGACYSFATPAPANMSVSPPGLSFLVSPGGAQQKAFSIGNTSPEGSAQLSCTLSIPGKGQWTEAIGTPTGMSDPFTNRYRGNIYEITSPNIMLRSFDQCLSFTDTRTLHFAVYECAQLTGLPYTRIFEQYVDRTGTGGAFYSSDYIGIPLQQGKFYILAAGWDGTAVSYGYQTSSVPRNVSFGVQRNGFGSDSGGYPLAATATNGGSVNTYNQQLHLSQGWLSLDTDTAAVNPGASAAILATADSAGLAAGTYTGQVVVNSNDPDDRSATIPVLLHVGAECFTQLFDSETNDLGWSSLCLIPDGSPSFYTACSTPVSDFPVSSSGANPLSPGNDSFVQVTLTGGKQVSLYGATYGSFYAGSNGYITFGAGDVTAAESASAHFALPRVSGLFDALDPAHYGAMWWKQLPDRAVVTWQGVAEYGSANSNDCQIELFFDGAIRITWLGVDATDGLAGVSAGAGVPASFGESDLSAYFGCAAPAAPVLLNASAAGDHQIDLTWSDRSTNETSFIVERDAGSGFAPLFSAPRDAAGASNTGLAKLTHYAYRVRAANVWGMSDPTNESSAQTLPVVLSSWRCE